MVCSKCGAEVEENSQFCSNCGKRVEREKKDSNKEWEICTFIFAAISLILLLAIVVLFVLFRNRMKFQENLTAEMQSDVIALQSQVSSLEVERDGFIEQVDILIEERDDYRAQVNTLGDRNRSLLNKISDMSNEIAFYEDYACIVMDDGTKKYHTYNCDAVINTDNAFWIFNLNMAEDRGYYACPVCH